LRCRDGGIEEARTCFYCKTLGCGWAFAEAGMAWKASIRVVDKRGRGLENIKVTAIFRLLQGYDTEYTDEEGWVEFGYDIDEDEEMNVVNLYVDSEEVDSDFTLTDGDTRSYTFDK
jgi:hypothetical protein